MYGRNVVISRCFTQSVLVLKIKKKTFSRNENVFKRNN